MNADAHADAVPTNYDCRELGLEELQSPELRRCAWRARALGAPAEAAVVSIADMPEVLQLLLLANGRAAASWGRADDWTDPVWYRVPSIDLAIAEFLADSSTDPAPPISERHSLAVGAR